MQRKVRTDLIEDVGARGLGEAWPKPGLAWQNTLPPQSQLNTRGVCAPTFGVYVGAAHNALMLPPHQHTTFNWGLILNRKSSRDRENEIHTALSFQKKKQSFVSFE